MQSSLYKNTQEIFSIKTDQTLVYGICVFETETLEESSMDVYFVCPISKGKTYCSSNLPTFITQTILGR